MWSCLLTKAFFLFFFKTSTLFFVSVVLLLLLSLFSLPVQTTNLRRNLKKQKSHHPGRPQHPFPLVNHSIFSVCDHRRRPTSICSRTRLRQTQEQIPRGPRAWPFSKDSLLGCGALAVLSVLGATSALSVPPPPPLPFPPRALIPTRLRLEVPS